MCLGELKGVKYACCGHGYVEDAYIKFDNNEELRAEEAIEYFKKVVDNK